MLERSKFGKEFLNSGHRRTSADEKRKHDEEMKGYMQSLTGGERVNGERGSVERNIASDRNVAADIRSRFTKVTANSRDLSRENYGARRGKKLGGVERRESGGGL
jgi:hypothetical protein